MENATFTALSELGLLCLGTPLPAEKNDADSGDHHYRGHHQFCRYENHLYRFPFDDPDQSVFDLYEPDMTLDQALRLTNLVVLLGASPGPAMQRCLEDPDTMVLIFEPDETVLATFLQTVKVHHLAKQRAFLFLGDPYSFDPALQDLLPRGMFPQGTPAFFQTDRIAERYPQWAAQTVEYLEILHFRHAIHPLTGQQLKWSHPLRSIKRERTYPQLLHSYENIPDYLTSPDISQLKDRFQGQPAILVAAGPALPEKFDYIRRNRNNAVVIAVNNAVKPLVEAGIKPHFTIINDTSLESGEVFKKIPALPGTILVGHCLSDLGGDKFLQKYLFDSHLETIFPERPELALHGSVITTAFSLARHMGCDRCVIAGAQLASHDPWKLAYAKGATNHSPDKPERPLIHRSPQLYPVATPFNDTLYTTTNFRDAALWLMETIRLSGVQCFNTTKDSILFGPGITHESEPELSPASLSPMLAPLFKPTSPKVNLRLVLQYIAREKSNWTTILKAAGELLRHEPAALLAKGSVILKQLDESGVTFMLEGYPTYNNRQFHTLAFLGTPEQRVLGFRYFFEHLRDMADQLLATLRKAEQDCRNLPR